MAAVLRAIQAFKPLLKGQALNRGVTVRHHEGVVGLQLCDAPLDCPSIGLMLLLEVAHPRFGKSIPTTNLGAGQKPVGHIEGDRKGLQLLEGGELGTVSEINWRKLALRLLAED